MDERKSSGVRSFVVGGLLGASAVVAAARSRGRRRSRESAAGLAAFEGAPCYQELAAKEAVAVDAHASADEAADGNGEGRW